MIYVIIFVKILIILLHQDAKEYAIKLALELVHFKKVKVVFFFFFFDVNDLGKSEILKLVYNSCSMQYKDLIELKN